MIDPDKDTYAQIEEIVRTACIRLILFAVAMFCLGYLVG